MSTWLSTHGAGAISGSDSAFVITANSAGALIRPSNPNKINGTVLFPLPCLPRDVSRLATVTVDFSSQTAYVSDIAVMSGSDTVFQKKDLQKTGEFNLRIYGESFNAEELQKGLTLAVGVTFESVVGNIRFRSVGLEVNVALSVPVQSVRFATGSWNTTDVRPWNQPTEKTSGHIEFPSPFSAPPTVMVSMNTVSLADKGNFRVKVYATGISAHGFDVHADTWGGTTLCSCGVSWMALGS
jgi:hypothetical protein